MEIVFTADSRKSVLSYIPYLLPAPNFPYINSRVCGQHTTDCGKKVASYTHRRDASTFTGPGWRSYETRWTLTLCAKQVYDGTSNKCILAKP